MPRHRAPSWIAAAALWTVALFAAGSCDGPDGRWQGEVAMRIDLEAGQRWTAQGAPVDRGQFCPDGIRHVLEARDPATDDIVRVRVWSQIVEAAATVRTTTEITLVVEHTCADGSGSFVTVERWGPDLWSVESGTGAYVHLTGGGELWFATVRYTEITPLLLHLDGALDG
ncbi:MAG TPA: hypothetical protein VK853_09975 [Ilumatobacteraceae bacterium]|nr:hypothetical protein [Ilumatobacteraceae bacterium]